MRRFSGFSRLSLPGCGILTSSATGLYFLAAQVLFLFLFILDRGLESVRGGDGGRDDGNGEETVVMRKKGAFLDSFLFLFRLLLKCILTLRRRITCGLFVIMIALPLPSLLILRSTLLILCSSLLFPALLPLPRFGWAPVRLCICLHK